MPAAAAFPPMAPATIWMIRLIWCWTCFHPPLPSNSFAVSQLDWLYRMHSARKIIVKSPVAFRAVMVLSQMAAKKARAGRNHPGLVKASTPIPRIPQRHEYHGYSSPKDPQAMVGTPPV